MGNSVIEQYWNLVNRFEDLLLGGKKSEDEPCPIGIPLYPPQTAFTSTASKEVHKILYLCFPQPQESLGAYPFSNQESHDFFEKWLQSIGLSVKEHTLFFELEKEDDPNEMVQALDEKLNSCRPRLILISESSLWSLFASQNGIGYEDAISRFSKEGFASYFNYRGIPLFPIYAPNEVLQNSSLKRSVWDTLKQIKLLFES